MTKEEVVEHFKDAKLVRCLSDTDVYHYDEETVDFTHGYFYCFDGLNGEIVILFQYNEFAVIVEYKEKPKEMKDSGLKEMNERISKEFDRLKEKVLQKNIDYNNSLQNPIMVFQKSKIDGILGRLDDKLGRIKAVGINDDTEDTIDDIIGYLVHLNIAKED